jgi:hypothetical protein
MITKCTVTFELDTRDYHGATPETAPVLVAGIMRGEADLPPTFNVKCENEKGSFEMPFTS